MIGENGMPIEVLLVEDSPGDVRLDAGSVSRSQSYRFDLHVATDGVEAMAFLKQRGNPRQTLRGRISSCWI